LFKSGSNQTQDVQNYMDPKTLFQLYSKLIQEKLPYSNLFKKNQRFSGFSFSHFSLCSAAVVSQTEQKIGEKIN